MIELPVATTLEEAQEQILTLQQAHTDLTNERNSLNSTLETERTQHQTEITERDNRITTLRDHNQKLFLRASAAIIDPPAEKGGEDDKPDTLEDFAKNMKGVF